MLVLAACTSTDPYPAEPSKAMVHALEVQWPQSAATDEPAAGPVPSAVAVCYNSLVNSDDEIWAEARLACPDGRLTARDDDVLWTRCSLTQPQRANFICVPDGAPVSAQ